MEQSIITLGVVVLVAVGTYLGASTAMQGFVDADYSITPPGDSETADELMSDINTTAVEIKSSLTGEQSWVQTAFNIFFTLPNNVMSTLSTISNSAGKVISLGTNEENPVAVPSWALYMMYTIIALMVVGSLIYLAIGRRG